MPTDKNLCIRLPDVPAAGPNDAPILSETTWCGKSLVPTECPNCTGGPGKTRDRHCKECNGRGRVSLVRAPFRTIDSAVADPEKRACRDCLAAVAKAVKAA